MENTPSYITILNKWWNDGNEKGFGLNIDCIGSQYRPDRTYKYLTFEAGAFGYYDENENWVPPLATVHTHRQTVLTSFASVARRTMLAHSRMVDLTSNTAPMV
jgi:hypothetical protein